MLYRDLFDIADLEQVNKNYKQIIFLVNELHGKLGGKYLTISGFLKLKEKFRENQLNIVVKNWMENGDIKFVPVDVNDRLPSITLLAKFIEDEKNIDTNFSKEDGINQIKFLSESFQKLALEVIIPKKENKEAKDIVEKYTFTLVKEDHLTNAPGI